MADLRVLCLHGQQASAEILEWQLGPLASKFEHHLGMTFHQVDGLIEADPDPCFEGIFEPPFFDWVQWRSPDDSRVNSTSSDASLATVRAAFELLDHVVEEQGPFDGILGFSQGASVACAYLAHLDRRDGSCSPFRFAIFFSSGGLSADHLLLLHRLSGMTDKEQQKTPALEGLLSMPALHVHGNADKLKDDALAMVRLWQPGSAVVASHQGGHVIPRDVASIGRIVSAAKLMMQSVVS
ncbi:serine hydrolase FSH [Plectosphaerella cucumerina]|uniref:Serine hydrolase FSH n=1 Tax=Plectosphaerella cucumerina TaxID=40658 RepID=A0A8K0X6V3_9PEZI|nr:serine hydrolase FSH [Plectosphaerella cucumerina]